jgi:hypothetical protein
VQSAAAAQHRSPLIHPREDRRSDLYGIAYRGRHFKHGAGFGPAPALSCARHGPPPLPPESDWRVR